jgi:hypothetical protein
MDPATTHVAVYLHPLRWSLDLSQGRLAIVVDFLAGDVASPETGEGRGLHPGI